MFMLAGCVCQHVRDLRATLGGDNQLMCASGFMSRICTHGTQTGEQLELSI